MDHLFLHCELAMGLWNRLFSKAGLSWVNPAHGSSMLGVDFQGLSKTKGAKDICFMLGCALMAVL